VERSLSYGSGHSREREGKPGRDAPPDHRVRRSLFVLGVFVVATVVLTWPVARRFTTHVPGVGRDSFLNCWAMVCEARAPARLDLANVFHGNIFHPNTNTVLFSENLVGWQPIALPVWALTGSPVVLYNVVFLLSFVLTGCCTYLLVRGLTGSTAAGVAAGLAFAFGPFRMAHAGHVQILSAHWTPLTLLCLHPGRRSRGPFSWAAAAGGAFAMQMLTCLYLGVFLAVAVGFFVAYFLLVTGQVRSGRTWRGLVLAAVIAAAGSAWLFPLYDAGRRKHVPIGRSLVEMTQFSARPLDYVTPTGRSFVWSRLGFVNREDERDDRWLGVVVPLLALVGLVATVAHCGPRRPSAVSPSAMSPSAMSPSAMSPGPNGSGPNGSGPNGSGPNGRHRGLGSDVAQPPSAANSRQPGPPAPHVRLAVRGSGRLAVVGFYVLLIVVAGVLSLGPTLLLGETRAVGWGPFRLLRDHVPGFRGIRAPGRFSMLVALSLAVLAGYGVAALEKAAGSLSRARGGHSETSGKRTTGPFFLMAIALLVLVEIVPAKGKRLMAFPLDADARACCRWLKALPAPVVIADVPAPMIGHYEHWRDYRYLARAMLHGRPTINGGSKRPLSSVISADALARFPGDDAIGVMQGAGVTHVVVHLGREWAWDLTETDLTDTRLRRLERFGDAIVYALAPLAAPEPVPPPIVATPAPPGTVLFVATRLPWSRTTDFGMNPGRWGVTWTPLGGTAPVLQTEAHAFPWRSGFIYLATRIRVPDEVGAYTLRVRDVDGRFDHTLPVEVSSSARIEALAVPPRARITADMPDRLRAGKPHYLTVRLENVGTTIWPARRRPGVGRPDHDVRLGWYLLDGEGKRMTSGRRFLRCDLAPGQHLDLGFALFVPDRPGRYTLTIDPRVEHHKWFASLGSTPLVRTIEVD